MNDLCRTGPKIFSMKSPYQISCACKEGDISLSKGCSELIYFALFSFTFWGPALPPVDAGVPPKHSYKGENVGYIYSKGHPNLLLTSCRTLDKSFCAHGLKYQSRKQGWTSHCNILGLFLKGPQATLASMCKMPVIPVLGYLYHSCCVDERVNVHEGLWLLHKVLKICWIIIILSARKQL